ncbi:recombination protein NinG, partial [Staphylococcus aureus]
AFANQWWCSPECGTKIALERRSKEREKAEKAAEKKRRREEQKPVSYTHLRAHETLSDLVCRLLLEKKVSQSLR